MNTRFLSKLDQPYREMLESLKDIKGYNEFLEFIRPRVGKNADWEAEVLALFEINKVRHPLVEICSQDCSAPEGIFKKDNRLGIIEAARISYLFDSNFEKQRKINKIENSLAVIIKLLRDRFSSYNVRFEIENLDAPISDTDLENARTSVFHSAKAGGMLPITILTEIGRISIERGEAVDLSNSESDLIIGMSDKGGIAARALNTDLNKKVGRVLKSKRTQHKTKYAGHLRIYYFLIDCPADRLLEVDPSRILTQLDDNEMMCMCTVFGSTQTGRPRLTKAGILIPGKGLNLHLFDLSNRYFQGYRFPDPRYVKKIF